MGMFFGDDPDNKVKETSNGFTEEIAGLNNAIAMAKICLIPFYLVFLLIAPILKLLDSIFARMITKMTGQDKPPTENPPTEDHPKLDSKPCKICIPTQDVHDQT